MSAVPAEVPDLPEFKDRRVETQTRLQMEAVECGAAALAMILEHHGRYEPLTELRRECGVSRDGSKASNLVKAARRYGFNAKGFRKELEQLDEIQLPAILFWNFNHFVVLEGFGKGKAYLNDPASGHRSVDIEELDECFTGVALLFEPTEDFEPGGEKPALLPALKSRLKGFGDALTYCMIAGLLLVLPGVVLPVYTQIFLDQVLGAQRVSWLRPMTVAMVATILLMGTVSLLQLRYLRRLKIGLAVKLSSQYFWHLLRLPMSFYGQRYAGEVASRSQLNDKLAEVLSGRLAITVIDMVMMIFYAVVMVFYDVTLTLIGVAFAGLNFAALRWIGKTRVEANMRLVQAQGNVIGQSIAALQGMETIKASGVESEFFGKWAGYYAKATNARQELEMSTQVLAILPTLLNSLTTMAIFGLGGIRVIQGDLSIGMLVAFQSLMASFQAPIGSLVSLGGTIQELEGDTARIDDVLVNPPEPHAARPPEPIPPGEPVRLEGFVELKDLTFGYNPLEPPLIENLNLSMRPGQRVALVGGSGSGKSTIAKIIAGLYTPWEGQVLLDGTPRAEVNPGLLVNSLSMVSQDVFLFEGSARDNLTLWDDSVSDDDLTRAARDAAVLDVIQAMPGGMDGELLEGGTNLSGGQCQRLEIARALVLDPSILVLDEATSALDTETEAIIDERLKRRGCTCVVVAHRLSTIRDCDEIIVLDRGKVLERGTHAELWDAGGAYAKLLRTDGGMVDGEAA